MTDGAAAVLVVSEDYLKKTGKKALARFVAFAVKGVPPEIMGIGPIAAIPAALKLAGLSLEDIGLIELNEAFAAQSLACVKGAWYRYGQGQCQWRRHCSRASAWLHRCQVDCQHSPRDAAHEYPLRHGFHVHRWWYGCGRDF